MPDRYEEKRKELMDKGMSYTEAQKAKLPEEMPVEAPVEKVAKKAKK